MPPIQFDPLVRAYSRDGLLAQHHAVLSHRVDQRVTMHELLLGHNEGGVVCLLFTAPHTTPKERLCRLYTLSMAHEREVLRWLVEGFNRLMWTSGLSHTLHFPRCTVISLYRVVGDPAGSHTLFPSGQDPFFLLCERMVVEADRSLHRQQQENHSHSKLSGDPFHPRQNEPEVRSALMQVRIGCLFPFVVRLQQRVHAGL